MLVKWEKLKKAEKGLDTQASVLADVSRALPALTRASKVQKKASDVGFDWDNAVLALPKVHEEAQEVLAELENGRDPAEELGDLLFSLRECDATLRKRRGICPKRSDREVYFQIFPYGTNDKFRPGKSCGGLDFERNGCILESGQIGAELLTYGLTAKIQICGGIFCWPCRKNAVKQESLKG